MPRSPLNLGAFEEGEARWWPLAAVINAKDSLALSIDSDYFTIEQKPFLSQLNKVGLSNDLSVNGQVIVVDVKKMMEPAPKALEEARGAITAAYQDSLEKEWITELRSKYPVTVNKDILYSIK